MKKAIAFVSAMLLAMSMTACGSGSSDNAGSQASTGSAASESQASTGSAESESGSSASGSESAGADSSSEAAAAGDGTVYQIGICQLVQHEALDAATQGFKDALTELMGEGNVEFSEQNASGDSATCATIINQFVSSDVDAALDCPTERLLCRQLRQALIRFRSWAPALPITALPWICLTGPEPQDGIFPELLIWLRCRSRRICFMSCFRMRRM